MVDFQSRDTRRGLGDDDEDEDEETNEEPAPDDEQAAADDGEPTSEEEARQATAEDSEGAGIDDGDGQPETADAAATDDGPGAATGADPLAESGSAGGPAAADEGGEEPAAGGQTAGAGPTGSKAAGGRPETAAEGTAGPTIDVAVVSVGSDDGGAMEAVVAAVESGGHAVATRERLRADYDGVQQAVDTLAGRDDVDAVVTVGGVGITPDQVTVEATHPLFSKALPGFGEAFRSLLFEHIGTGIVAERSTAGVADGTVVFCLPGDAEAARLAVEEIVVPEGPRLVDHLGQE